MNNYILYYYLREDFGSPFYVGYGKPRRINAKHLRSNGANLLPPRQRRWIVKSGLTKEHIALWKRECDGGVLLNQNLGGEGKPGGQKTKGFSGRKHSEEAKKRISEKVAGKNNPRYGVKLSQEIRNKISQNRTPKFGKDNPNSKTWRIVSPENKEYIITGALKEFCKSQNISYATMSAAIKYDRKGPRRNGWSIEEKV
jgi:hypothetical protein